jgi:GDP-L-fucose synthase
MVGSAVVRRLGKESISEVVAADSGQVDLTRQAEAEEFVRSARPDVAVIAAAKVGGINANRQAQADFLYENLMISANSLRAAQLADVKKTVLLGSSCIYPRESPQPIPESALLTGPLEETNEGYAIAKIAAMEYGRMLRRQYGMDVISLMPTNLYGPGDNYDLETSHVLPALLRKIHDAKAAGHTSVQVWGSGRPRREFLHVDDLADAVVFALHEVSGEDHLNVGTGVDISILDLATTIADVVGWQGEFVLDTSMPDGTPRKLLDVSKLANMGWKATVDLRSGLESTYRSFLEESAAS